MLAAVPGARTAPGAPVAAVNLKVGKLSTVVPESLRLCFDILRRDTPLSGVRLNIEVVPVVLDCLDCGTVTTIEAPRFVCGGCGGTNTRQVTGSELTVESFELAGPGAPASADRRSGPCRASWPWSERPENRFPG